MVSSRVKQSQTESNIVKHSQTESNRDKQSRIDTNRIKQSQTQSIRVYQNISESGRLQIISDSFFQKSDQNLTTFSDNSRPKSDQKSDFCTS